MAAVRANLQSLGVRSAATLETRGVGSALRNLSRRAPCWTIVFLDPPYEAQQEYAGTLALLGDPDAALLAPGAIVVAEHRRRPPVALAETYGGLTRYRVLEQGDAVLSFYRMADEQA
jgi:16S rRNA G966 N2-methylase RsmD